MVPPRDRFHPGMLARKGGFTARLEPLQPGSPAPPRRGFAAFDRQRHREDTVLRGTFPSQGSRPSAGSSLTLTAPSATSRHILLSLWGVGFRIGGTGFGQGRRRRRRRRAKRQQARREAPIPTPLRGGADRGTAKTAAATRSPSIPAWWSRCRRRAGPSMCTSRVCFPSRVFCVIR